MPDLLARQPIVAGPGLAVYVDRQEVDIWARQPFAYGPDLSTARGYPIADAAVAPPPAEVTGANVTDDASIPSPTVQVDLAVSGANVTDDASIPSPTVATWALVSVTGANVTDDASIPSPTLSTTAGLSLTVELTSFVRHAWMVPAQVRRERGDG